MLKFEHEDRSVRAELIRKETSDDSCGLKTNN